MLENRNVFKDIKLGFTALQQERENMRKEMDKHIITKDEYNELLERKAFLTCLVSCGVQDWEGYEMALEMHDWNESFEARNANVDE